jgi:hypothetical protein
MVVALQPQDVLFFEEIELNLEFLCGTGRHSSASKETSVGRLSSFRRCCQDEWRSQERFSSGDVLSVWREDDWSLESDSVYMRSRIYFLSRCFWGNCIPCSAKFPFLCSLHF